MKYIFLIFSTVCLVYTMTNMLHAVDYPNTPPPVGSVPNIDGWSYLGNDRYRLSTQGSNAQNVGTSSVEWENILWVSNTSLREGNVDINTIPTIIRSIINVLLGVAGTVAIFSLIYHAVQMQLNSGITGDSSGVDKAKKWMIGALIWFVIAIAAWFLVTRAVDLLSAVS